MLFIKNTRNLYCVKIIQIDKSSYSFMSRIFDLKLFAKFCITFFCKPYTIILNSYF